MCSSGATLVPNNIHLRHKLARTQSNLGAGSSLALSTSSKPAMHSAIFMEFMFGYLPKDRRRGRHELEVSAMTWMTTVADAQEELPFMRYASGALGIKAISVASKGSTDASSLRADWDLEGERLYGQAVCALQKASTTMQKGQAFQLLAASVALILFEVYNAPSVSRALSTSEG